jgi:Protein of unknown function (DUF4038)/Putative collagen-binding domain of a collagenase/Family of unknown function (DUF6298)
MSRVFAIWTATALVLSLGGRTASAGRGGDGAAAPPDKGMRLKVSPNGRYFVDQDGKPFFYLGDTCWLLFQRLDRKEIDEYLKDRVAKGFNVIQAYVIRGLDERHPDGNTSLLGKPPFIDRDPTEPNPVYFKNMDYVINRANELGLVMGLVVAKSWHVTKHPEQVFDAKNAHAFGTFLGARYKDNAVIWYVGGDSSPGSYEAVWVAMAKGLKDGSGGRQLVCYHGSGQTSSSTWFHQADWLDFNSVQSGHRWATNTYEFIVKDHGLSPAKPTVDIEPPYENHPTGPRTPRIDSHQVRKGAYWNLLSGAAGHGYGALDLFWFYKDDDGPFPKNGFLPWRKAMAYEGAQQLGYMRRLFELRPWYKLVPDQSVIAAGHAEGEDHVRAGRAEDGSFVIAYLPFGKPVSIRMDKVSGKTLNAQWYDPRKGTWHSIGEFANSGVRDFTAPSRGEKDDWVLVLDASRTGGHGDSRTEGERTPINGPLRRSKNPNYFEDASGTPLILCGSHTWNTLQDWGTNGTTRPLDFDAFVTFLKTHGHNFTLLWCTELPKFHGLPTTETSPPDFTVSPFPWLRTGPGLATDGGSRFDLTKPDEAYFHRLRARAQALNRAGIYVGVYLFSGEFLLRFRCATDGYPFSGPNNINGVDDGYRGGSPATAVSSVTMTAPNAITHFQDAYVRKVIDTLNDLPNVLWIVSQESPIKSAWWNDHLISLVRDYEQGKRYQHPIGYGTLEHPTDSILYNSDADWVAPWAKISPEKSCGTGKPSCKVNINDSDHSYFGMWNDTPQVNRNYAWENFMTGNQVLFMDPYLVHYPRENRNLIHGPVSGIGSEPDARWENFRNTLGDILRYSRKVNLANVTPRSTLCSTHYCLAETPSAGAEYLVYAPSGGSLTVDLSAMPNSRMLAVEWFNPATRKAISQRPIAAGSSSQSFTAPFSGDAVLYLVDTARHK